MQFCRLWVQGGNRPTTTAKLSIVFNDEVQIDLLFSERRIVGHLCDGCIRFTVARELTDNTLDTLLDFIWTAWIQMLGPMAVLTVDGEGALAAGARHLARRTSGGGRRAKCERERPSC